MSLSKMNESSKNNNPSKSCPPKDIHKPAASKILPDAKSREDISGWRSRESSHEARRRKAPRGCRGKNSGRQDPPNNYWDFYGRDFLITPDVLTPRPETEQLIDEVLTLAGKPFLPGVKAPEPVLSPAPIILDVGTGSGCIAITIKKELPEATVYATDISEKALDIAKKNAENLGASITTIISYLLEKVKDDTIPTPDLLVANLPYVDPEWDWLDKPALEKTDPALALYAADHGLALIKELIEEAEQLKIPRLLLESDPCQHAELAEFALGHGYDLKRTNGFITYYLSL